MKAKIENGSLVIKKGEPTPRYWSWVVLILLAIILALISTFALRQNNLNMTNLRDELVTADETGDVEAVQTAAQKLQNYVAHHMNTVTGKVALQTLYNQAAEEAMEASKPADISTDVYQQATEACKPQLTNYGYRAWASCVATKVGLNATTTLATADDVAPDPDLYYVEYAPARWSADLAGISLLLFCVVMAILIIRIIVLIIVKLVDIRRKRQPAGVYRG